MLAEYLVNYEDTLNLPTLSKPQDDARDVLLNEFDRLEQEVEWLREAARWIPVGERLPENNTINLCVGRDYPKGKPYRLFGHFWNGRFITGETKITHWMPLPEPPEVE